MLPAFAFALAAVSGAASAPTDTFATRAWAHFSRHPSLAHSSETVEIAVAGSPPREREWVYTMRLTRSRFQQPDTILWADSRTCPAMQQVLKTMRGVTLPHPQVPGIDAFGDIVMDGVGYRLRTLARFPGTLDGQLEFDSNVGTPLAAWIDASLAALAPCWSGRDPR